MLRIGLHQVDERTAGALRCLDVGLALLEEVSGELYRMPRRAWRQEALLRRQRRRSRCAARGSFAPGSYVVVPTSSGRAPDYPSHEEGSGGGARLLVPSPIPANRLSCATPHATRSSRPSSPSMSTWTASLASPI